jgi:hypothetical protein
MTTLAPFETGRLGRIGLYMRYGNLLYVTHMDGHASCLLGKGGWGIAKGQTPKNRKIAAMMCREMNKSKNAWDKQ